MQPYCGHGLADLNISSKQKNAKNPFALQYQPHSMYFLGLAIIGTRSDVPGVAALCTAKPHGVGHGSIIHVLQLAKTTIGEFQYVITQHKMATILHTKSVQQLRVFIVSYAQRISSKRQNKKMPVSSPPLRMAFFSRTNSYLGNKCQTVPTLQY